MPGPVITPFRCDLTPDFPVPLAGYRRRSGDWERIETPLEANGIVFETETGRKALIAIDTLFAGNALSAAVAEAWRGAGPAPEFIWLASHSHAAPALDPTKPMLGAVDDAYFAKVAETIAAAIKDAAPLSVATRRSGRATIGGATWRRRTVWHAMARPPFLRRRTGLLPAPGVEIPRNLVLHVLEDEDGRPVAVLWTWPCHPLTTGDLGAVSADFPGLLRDRLRRALGVPELAMLYAPGFCGDIRPDITTRGLSARSALRHPVNLGTLPVFRRPTPRDQARMVDRLWSGMEEALRGEAVSVPEGARVVDSSFPACDLRHASGDPASIGLVRCDVAGVTVLAIGAEVSARHHDRLAGLFPDGAILTGCANQTLGYLPCDEQLPEGGYEVAGFRDGFSLKGAWATGIDAALTKAASELHR